MTVIERIKARREELGLSRPDVADALGYKSRSTYNKLENGSLSLSVDQLIKIAEILQTDPAVLLGSVTQAEWRMLYDRRRAIAGKPPKVRRTGQEFTREEIKILRQMIRDYREAHDGTI